GGDHHLHPGHASEGKQVLTHAGVVALHRGDLPPGSVHSICTVGGNGQGIALWFETLVTDEIEGEIAHPRNQHLGWPLPHLDSAPAWQGGRGQLPECPCAKAPIHECRWPTWPGVRLRTVDGFVQRYKRVSALRGRGRCSSC